MPGSSDEGPRWLFLSFIVKILLLLARIGAAWDYIWWKYFLEKHQPAPTGHFNDHINTGVFIIRPGKHYINRQSILGSNWCSLSAVHSEVWISMKWSFLKSHFCSFKLCFSFFKVLSLFKVFLKFAWSLLEVCLKFA